MQHLTCLHCPTGSSCPRLVLVKGTCCSCHSYSASWSSTLVETKRLQQFKPWREPQMMPKCVVQVGYQPSLVTPHTGTSDRAMHTAITGTTLAVVLPLKTSPFDSKFPSFLYGPLHPSKLSTHLHLKPPQPPANPLRLTPPQQLLPSCTYPLPSQLSSFCISPKDGFLPLAHHFLNLITYCLQSLNTSGFGRGRFRCTLSGSLQICP